MGYQRGERGRLASLITVIILGVAVVSIDHISGRSVRPSPRSEAANQVISMDVAGSSEQLFATSQPESPECTLSRCQRPSQVKGAAPRTTVRDSAAVTNSLKLKARELQDTDWPVLARLSGVTVLSQLTKKPRFLELQTDSIPPLQKRLIAASQVTSVKSVSIRLEGEVRISKLPAPASASLLYLIGATSERPARKPDGKSRPVLALPQPQPGWKCSKATS